MTWWCSRRVEWSALATDDLVALTTSQWTSLATDDLVGLVTSQWSTLATDDLVALVPAQWSRVATDDLVALTAHNGAFLPRMICKLLQEFNGLRLHRISPLNNGLHLVCRVLSTSTARSGSRWPPMCCRRLPATQWSQMQTDDLQALSGGQWSSLRD
jgi:hypothetical protein